jgi:hypothetical protein
MVLILPVSNLNHTNQIKLIFLIIINIYLHYYVYKYKMTSVLETLSLKELYTRKKNLIFQLEKVDEAIKNKLENEPDINIEITPYLNKDINELEKKIVIRKNINNGIQASSENTLQESHEIIRKITIKIKK